MLVWLSWYDQEVCFSWWMASPRNILNDNWSLFGNCAQFLFWLCISASVCSGFFSKDCRILVLEIYLYIILFSWVSICFSARNLKFVRLWGSSDVQTTCQIVFNFMFKQIYNSNMTGPLTILLLFIQISNFLFHLNGNWTIWC